ncbi:MAG TPA: response regulator transcription factor [Thermoleophilaceae bacterium]|nr:response regulator transcription factor [Thermoleophilaceae bacterium]
MLIVTDIRLYREGLAHILRRERGVQVAATASASEALAAVTETRPSVALVDMATEGALDTIRDLARSVPDLRIVALAVPETEGEVIACAEAGISGLVNRDASLDDLVDAIDSAARGEMLCSPRVAASLLRRVRTLAAERSATPADLHLTAREVQILRLIEQGLSNKEIAQRLCIQVATVKHHVHNLLEKLGARRRGEAVARMRGLLAASSRGR